MSPIATLNRLVRLLLHHNALLSDWQRRIVLREPCVCDGGEKARTMRKGTRDFCTVCGGGPTT